MTIYTCTICDKLYNHKNDYNRHMLTHTNKAIKIIDNMINVCVYCNRILSSKYILKEHMNKCRESPLYVVMTEQLVAKEKELNTFRSKILQTELIGKQQEETLTSIKTTQESFIPNTIHNTINIYGDVNMNNTIAFNDIIEKHFNKFGTEIALEQLLNIKQREHIVQQGGGAVKKWTEYKHFDPNHPENHNMYLEQKKHSHAMIFDGEKFIEMPFDDIINYIIFKSHADLCNFLTDPNIKLDYNQKRNINNLIKKIKENNPHTRNMIEEDIRNIMYENRELVINTFKFMMVKLKANKQIISVNSENINNVYGDILAVQ